MRVFFAEYKKQDIKGVVDGNIIKIITTPNDKKYSFYVITDKLGDKTLQVAIKEAVEMLMTQIDNELKNN